MLTLQQIANLKRDAYKPNWGSKSYSPQVVIALIEVIERYIGEIPVDRPRPRDPFDLSYQVAVGPLNDERYQLALFTEGNFLII